MAKKTPPKKGFFAGLFSEDPEERKKREREEKEEQRARERAAKEEQKRNAENEKIKTKVEEEIQKEGRKEKTLVANRITVLNKQRDHHRRDCTDCLAYRTCAACDEFDSDINALSRRLEILSVLYPG